MTSSALLHVNNFHRVLHYSMYISVYTGFSPRKLLQLSPRRRLPWLIIDVPNFRRSCTYAKFEQSKQQKTRYFTFIIIALTRSAFTEFEIFFFSVTARLDTYSVSFIASLNWRKNFFSKFLLISRKNISAVCNCWDILSNVYMNVKNSINWVNL